MGAKPGLGSTQTPRHPKQRSKKTVFERCVGWKAPTSTKIPADDGSPCGCESRGVPRTKFWYTNQSCCHCEAELGGISSAADPPVAVAAAQSTPLRIGSSRPTVSTTIAQKLLPHEAESWASASQLEWKKRHSCDSPKLQCAARWATRTRLALPAAARMSSMLNLGSSIASNTTEQPEAKTGSADATRWTRPGASSKSPIATFPASRSARRKTTWVPRFSPASLAKNNLLNAAV
mmetsp:Transcript_50564/g.141610  ORF Transcript_50564/g.141610 Transcript_50564/m.141610 type:complete len:234 (-) Transcript_50564:350-1051(-)